MEGPEQGAVVTFTGTVRRQGQQPNVARLEYEAYVPMAEEVLGAIAAEIEREYPGRARGHPPPHRHPGGGRDRRGHRRLRPPPGRGLRRLPAAIERLKQRAPIWKKEIGEDGAVWVGTGP